MKAIMYGAGNIGRGFIGQLFFQSGYDVAFIDIDRDLIDALNSKRTYPVRILHGDFAEEAEVQNVSGIDGRDINAVAGAIAEADLMATAVGVNVLKFIAEPIAAGIRLRYEQGRGPLNIIICENLLNADEYLKTLLKERVSPDEYKWMLENIGFVEASIGRMVPIQTPEMQAGNPLRVCAEAYALLPVDKNAFKGDIPDIKGLVPFSPFSYYIERKLFIHNMGHAMTAYLGSLYGDEYIWQSIARKDIYDSVRGAMLQSARTLSLRHEIPMHELESHIDDLLHRFSNRQLSDTNFRVGRDLRRKLGRSDRMAGALYSCISANLPCDRICTGIAAALLFLEDNLTAEMTSEEILQEISQIPPDSGFGKEILSRQRELLFHFYKIQKLSSAG